MIKQQLVFRLICYSYTLLTLFTSCSGQNQQDTSVKIGEVVSHFGTDSRNVFQSRDIFQDSKNNFWFATDGDGVYKFDGKSIVHFDTTHGLPSNFVWNVIEGKDGKMWFRTRDGLCYLNDSVFIMMYADKFTFGPTKYNFKKETILVDHYFDGRFIEIILLPKTSPLLKENTTRFDYDIYCSFKDSKGNIWFGTQSAGVCKYDGETYTWLDNQELGAAVRSIFEDKNGNIWIGNNGGGLFKCNPENLKTINFSSELNVHNFDPVKYPSGHEGMMTRVWTITDDNQGNLWVGTIDNGVWMYDGNKLTNYTTTNGLPITSIWTIFKDKSGKLWFGTDGAGVYTFDGKSFQHFSGQK